MARTISDSFKIWRGIDCRIIGRIESLTADGSGAYLRRLDGSPCGPVPVSDLLDCPPALVIEAIHLARPGATLPA